MPNIDNLIDTIQQNLNTSASQETAYYSTLDLKYAYSQLKLDPETARHCNFNIISVERTGTYRFITGFYGLTDMPAAFQKVMDYTLVGLKNTYCFLDDIIVIITAKRDKTVKLALDSQVLNKSIHKNKYQMPNIDNLIDTIQQKLNTTASQETAYFSTLDLKYAYSQLNLDPETARHCNFNIFRGEGTGTYRFITGFCGLT